MMRFTLKSVYTGSQFQRRGPANEIALMPASAKLCPREGRGSFPEEHRLPGGTGMVLRLSGRVWGHSLITSSTQAFHLRIKVPPAANSHPVFCPSAQAKESTTK